MVLLGTLRHPPPRAPPTPAAVGRCARAAARRPAGLLQLQPQPARGRGRGIVAATAHARYGARRRHAAATLPGDTARRAVCRCRARRRRGTSGSGSRRGACTWRRVWRTAGRGGHAACGCARRRACALAHGAALGFVAAGVGGVRGSGGPACVSGCVAAAAARAALERAAGAGCARGHALCAQHAPGGAAAAVRTLRGLLHCCDEEAVTHRRRAHQGGQVAVWIGAAKCGSLVGRARGQPVNTDSAPMAAKGPCCVLPGRAACCMPWRAAACRTAARASAPCTPKPRHVRTCASACQASASERQRGH
eukprot:57772-Chlamydomonas_euryale.AAC.2